MAFLLQASQELGSLQDLIVYDWMHILSMGNTVIRPYISEFVCENQPLLSFPHNEYSGKIGRFPSLLSHLSIYCIYLPIYIMTLMFNTNYKIYIYKKKKKGQGGRQTQPIHPSIAFLLPPRFKFQSQPLEYQDWLVGR
jgi:hypothetical protein